MAFHKQRRLLISVLLIFCSATWAKSVKVSDQKIDKLAHNIDRPTVEEVAKALGLKPGDEVSRDFGSRLYQSAKESVLEHLPQFVGSLEFYYPSGIYAFLGRDASDAADLLEAFYFSIGDPGRVKRLRSSGFSFVGITEDQSTLLVDYLITNGAPLNTPDLAKERPFVIADATSLRVSSQSTRIATAGIEYLRSQGYRDELIYQKLAVVDLSNRKEAWWPSSRREMIRQQTESSRHIYNGRILGRLTSRAFTYSTVWHHNFQTFRYREGTKEVYAPPGYLASIRTRRKIIENMLMFMNIVHDPEVKKAVMEYAEKKRIKFGELRVRSLPAKAPLETKKIYGDAIATINKLSFGGSVEYVERGNIKLSENGHEVMGLLRRYANEKNLFFAAVPALIQAHKASRIGDRDFRRLVAFALTATNLDEKEMLILDELSKAYPNLAELLSRRDIHESLIEMFPLSKENFEKIQARYKQKPVKCSLSYGKAG